MLALQTALKLDVEKRSEDEQEIEQADHFVQLITPILKAYFTDMGHEVANLGMQIYGGHGYIREYGMEQYARDARIAQIYEGANGIQALDLVGRKLPKDTGKYLRSFFHPATEFVAEHRENSDMAEFTKGLHTALKNAQQASLWVAANGMGDPNEAAAASVDYLKLMAIAVMAYMWAQMALAAQKGIKENSSDSEFYEAKLDTARFFMKKVVPTQYGLLATIVEGAKPVMAARL